MQGFLRGRKGWMRRVPAVPDSDNFLHREGRRFESVIAHHGPTARSNE